MIEWRHRQPVADYEKLEIFRYPFYLENALLIGLFSIIFVIASIWASLPAGMGIRSLTLWFVGVVIFFNYIFVIVDYTSRGIQRIPKLSGELVFPTHDYRLFTIAVLTICHMAFVLGGGEDTSKTMRLIIAFFTYPLMFSLLVVNINPLTLLNPIALARSLWIFSTSMDSAVFYGLQLATSSLLFFEIQSFGKISVAHVLWQVPITVTMLIMLFRSLGVVLNTQGPKFGLLVLQNAETHQAALEEQARVQLGEFILKLHRWVRVHEYKKAWALIEEFQREHQYSLDSELFHRLGQWDDQRLAAMLGASLAERLLHEGETERSLKVFRESYTMAPNKFVFSSGSVALLFADAALDEASREQVYLYLQRFDEQFPNHPNIVGAMVRVASLALDHFSDHDTADKFLQKALTLKPDLSDNSEYQRLAALLLQ